MKLFFQDIHIKQVKAIGIKWLYIGKRQRNIKNSYISSPAAFYHHWLYYEKAITFTAILNGNDSERWFWVTFQAVSYRMTFLDNP